jgi:hypothetical protein
MGRSLSKNSGGQTIKLVAIRTDTLKNQLNQLYDCMRLQTQYIFQSGMFDYLWDLKELALVEGKSYVEVPGAWLDSLNDALASATAQSMRGN